MTKSMFEMSCLMLFITILATPIHSVFAEWEPDQRLTFNDSLSYTVGHNAWNIAANQTGDAHVTFMDRRSGAWDIYYKRSTDHGVNWSSDIPLTNLPSNSGSPCLTLSDSIVHVVYNDNRDGNWDLFYLRSIDRGMTWETETRLTDDPYASSGPTICQSGSFIHVVWYDNRDSWGEVCYKRSTDHGVSWEPDTCLTNTPGLRSVLSTACATGTDVHVFWVDERDGTYEIFYKHSTDAGATWSADTQLTSARFKSLSPSAAALGSNVHVVWMDSRDSIPGVWEVYYKRSTDGGGTWGPDTRLTNAIKYSWYPSIAVSGSNVHVIWNDNRAAPSFDIYYKYSTDYGLTWSPDTQLTSSGFGSRYNSVSVADSTVHVVWTDWRDGNAEVYYKRNPTGNPGIQTESLPNRTCLFLYQSRPSLMSKSTTIRFLLSKKQHASLVVYNALCQKLKVLMNKELCAGLHEVIWNGRDESGHNVPNGVYFYRLETKDFAQTKKLVVLRL